MGDINYSEIAERAVVYAKSNNINLDYSEKSIEDVDYVLGCYYEHREEYEGEDGANTLWNIAVHFGIYIGETLLRLQLRDKGYEWYIDDGLPILKGTDNATGSPITKAHKRILNGPEDSVKSFFDVMICISNGDFPTKNVLRAVDVEMASGRNEVNVLKSEIYDYIMAIETGQEDFAILKSHDGFLQFYGVDNQFVAEVRVNLSGGDFRTYSIINEEKKNAANRIVLETPFGRYTPMERDVISLKQLKAAVARYYGTLEEQDFLEGVPYVDTTEETKNIWEDECGHNEPSGSEADIWRICEK